MEIKTRAEAIKAGEITYFTGQECKHGHTTYRYVKNGACSQCVKINNSGDVDPSLPARREARAALAQVKIRAFSSDRETISTAAWALASMRYPILTQGDVDPRLLPMNREPAGTALYSFYCHEDDIATLRGIANEALKAHKLDIDEARSRLIQAAAGYLPEDSTPPISFK